MKSRKPGAGEFYRRGVKSFRAGNIAAAKKLFEEAIHADASHAGAHHALGLIALQSGSAAQAVPHFIRAIELDAGKSAHFLNLGVALRRVQRYTDALAAYDRALALEPDSATTLNNRGNLLRDMERNSAALKDYDQALALQPDYAEAHHNRGVLLQKLGRLEDALAALAQAIRLRPEYVDAYNSRGNVLRDLGRWDDAWVEYGLAITAGAKPGDSAIARADAYYNRAAVWRDQGNGDAAAADLRAALALRPDFVQARWALAFSDLVPVHDSVEDMTGARDRFAGALQSLSAACHTESGQAAEWEPAVGAAQPFYLSYHGFNERESLREYGTLACSVMEDWHRRRGRVDRGLSPASRPMGDRIRVGFVSAQVHRHSVWDVLTRGWLTQLDRQQFDVICYHVGWRRDRETALARKSAGSFVMGPLPLSAWVDRIANDRPHVLIYPEIGMDPMTVKLAALRLAPVQCAAWGHPITSALPTMDYFLSADLLEPPDAALHYTETLVRLPNLGCFFEPLNPASGIDKSPELTADRVGGPAATDSSTSPGQDTGSPRFICCQQVAKYHPGSDAVFVRIAQALGQCRFTFIELARTHAAWERFRQRLERAFNGAGLNMAEFCTFMPTLPRREFLALLRRQDVYLDTLAFSGFTTAIQALTCNGLPVVTLEGDLLRKRLAAGILRHIGVPDTIAASMDEYIEIAVRLGREPAWRTDLRSKIKANLGRAYRDEAVIGALETFLRGSIH